MEYTLNRRLEVRDEDGDLKAYTIQTVNAYHNIYIYNFTTDSFEFVKYVNNAAEAEEYLCDTYKL